MRSFAREVVEAIILGAFIFLLSRQVVQTFRVEQRSMEPTLREGQYLLVYRAAYLEIDLSLPFPFVSRVHAADPKGVNLPFEPFGGPERGDIVVFSNPNGSTPPLIKRVIGVPGDTIAARDGVVFLNGNPLAEPYASTPITYPLEPRTIPAGHYFVLGDNRNNSYDSHIFGPIPRHLIVGRAYPLPLVWSWPVLPGLGLFARS
ncbi:MAG: signal peptidase I [Chloroflexi bacterium]|nr:signal peptidase I [Chloroflexota bacterium]